MEPTYIGQTRYSLFIPASGAWRASAKSNGQSEEDYKRYLYAPDRMDFRDRIFKELTVPALAEAAEHHQVWHIVSYSESLPEKYKKSLQDTAERYPFLLLQELPDGVSDWGRSEALIKEKVGEGVFGRYRLDDDDVLSRHYFELVSRFVKPEYVGMVVSLPRGIEAIYENGHYFNFREAHVPMNSMGMLYVSRVTEQGAIIGPHAGAHDKADRLAPVILDAREIAYLRTNHLGQDNMLRHESAFVAGRLISNMDKYPALRSTGLVRENFPNIAGLLLNDKNSVVHEWNDPLGNGIQLEFDRATSGLTVTISGEAPKITRRNPIALTLDLEGPSGGGLKASANIKGIATSHNPAIGQFIYFDVNAGKFEVSASAFLADGVRIRSARIVPLLEDAKQIRIAKCVVDHESSGVRFSGASARAARTASSGEKVGAKIRDLGQRAWPIVKPISYRILGVERTNAAVESAAARLKRIQGL